MQTRWNRRKYPEHYVGQRHLKLNDLKEESNGLRNNYLYKENIPEYPKPEFHTSRLKHESSGSVLYGIKGDGGFKGKRPFENAEPLIWWSLAVGPEEINGAETRPIETSSSNRVEVEGAEQQNFLWRFATSPAFLETSRLGSYRFTFPLQEVLTAYREQVCSGAEPVMRVYETVLYKQEVMYSVLIHSPKFNQEFSKYPLLKDDPTAVCVYRDGRFIWRSEAMCGTHWYELIIGNDADQIEVQHVACREQQFYVWDHVAVALHMEDEQVLKFDDNKLRQNLKFCEKDRVVYGEEFQDLHEAKKQVMDLWKEASGPLEREPSLQPSYPGQEANMGRQAVRIRTTPDV